jgi:hypothetical protein
MALGAIVNLSAFQNFNVDLILKFYKTLEQYALDVCVICKQEDKSRFEGLVPNLLCYNSFMDEVITEEKMFSGFRICFLPSSFDLKSYMMFTRDIQVFELEQIDEGLVVSSPKRRVFFIDVAKDETFSDLLLHIISDYSFSNAIQVDDTVYIQKGQVEGHTSSMQLHTKEPAGPPKISPIRVKLLTNWANSKDAMREWARLLNPQVPIVFNDVNPDIYVVINKTDEVTPEDKTIYFCMEPYGEELYADYLKTLKDPLFLGTHKHHLNMVEWHISPDLASIMRLQDKVIEKESSLDNTLSVILSSKYVDPLQKWRIDFVRYLDSLQQEGKLPFDLHIYGQCKDLNFANYKSELPRLGKEIGLLRYRYHFNCENNAIKNYVTEKLFDPILCETLCFYRGCPNVTDFIDRDSFITLPEDFDACVQLISESMKTEQQQKRISNMKKAKLELLLKYGFSSRLLGILILSSALVVLRNDTQDKDYVQYLENQSFKYIANVGFTKEDSDWIRQFVDNIVLKLDEHQSKSPIIVMTEKVEDDLLYDRLAGTCISNECDVISFGSNEKDRHLYNFIFKPSSFETLKKNHKEGNDIFQDLRVNYVINKAN